VSQKSSVKYTRSRSASFTSRVHLYIESCMKSFAHAPSAPYTFTNFSSHPGLTSNSHSAKNNVVPSPALGGWQFRFETPEEVFAGPSVAIRLDTSQGALRYLTV